MNRPPRRRSGVRYAAARKPAAHVRARTAIRSITASGISFAKHLVQSSLAVLAVLLLSVLGYGLLLRTFSPKPLIVVDPFEVPTDLAKEMGIEGKNGADIFIDQVNETAKAAQAFRGSEFSSKRHFGHVSNLFRVPVQSSYGLQISGISIDDLVGLYRRVRYEQWKISGDIYKNGSNIAVRVRIRRRQDSQDWEISQSQSAQTEAAIRMIAQQMLTANQPEAMGRAYLEWGLQATDPARKAELYRQAVDNFRTWGMRNPENPLPFYYMALAYHFLSQQQNSVDLAKWSAETAAYDQEWTHSNGGYAKDRMESLIRSRETKDRTVDYDHWLIANAKLDDSMAQDAEISASGPAARQDPAVAARRAQRIEDTLSGLVKRYPTDLEYRNDYAVSITNPAKKGDWESSYQSHLQAVAIQREVVKGEPDNPGFQMNLASELMNLAEVDHDVVAGDHPYPGHSKDAARKEMAQGLADSKQASVRALHLLPDSDRALLYFTDAVWLPDTFGVPLPKAERLAERDQGIHLCRTAILLSPNSSAMKNIYAHYLLNLYIVDLYQQQPEKMGLPDLERNKATQLLDKASFTKASEDLSKEIDADHRESWEAHLREANHELGFDAAAPTKP